MNAIAPETYPTPSNEMALSPEMKEYDVHTHILWNLQEQQDQVLDQLDQLWLKLTPEERERTGWNPTCETELQHRCRSLLHAVLGLATEIDPVDGEFVKSISNPKVHEFVEAWRTRQDTHNSILVLVLSIGHCISWLRADRLVHHTDSDACVPKLPLGTFYSQGMIALFKDAGGNGRLKVLPERTQTPFHIPYADVECGPLPSQ